MELSQSISRLGGVKKFTPTQMSISQQIYNLLFHKQLQVHGTTEKESQLNNQIMKKVKVLIAKTGFTSDDNMNIEFCIISPNHEGLFAMRNTYISNPPENVSTVMFNQMTTQNMNVVFPVCWAEQSAHQELFDEITEKLYSLVPEEYILTEIDEAFYEQIQWFDNKSHTKTAYNYELDSFFAKHYTEDNTYETVKIDMTEFLNFFRANLEWKKTIEKICFLKNEIKREIKEIPDKANTEKLLSNKNYLISQLDSLTHAINSLTEEDFKITKP